MKWSLLIIFLILLISLIANAEALTFTTAQQTKIRNYLNSRNYTYNGSKLNFTTINYFIFTRNNSAYIVTLKDSKNKNWTFIASRRGLNNTLGGMP